MAVNRFSKVVAPSRFSPLSFEEQSFAPILLRQREDQIMNDKDLLLQEMANLEVPEIYQDTLDNERTALENDLSSLAEKIQKEGAGNLNYLNEFRNLRNKYNKSVSKSGNIGRAVGVKTQMDAMKDAYFTDAYNKKQPAEHIARNWEIEKNKYLQGLPSDLNKFKGTLPEFTPDFAPDSISLSDSVKELAGFMTGMTEDIRQGFYFDTAPDGSLIAVDRKTGKASNEKQVNELKNLVESTLLNPDSPLNRNLKWRNIDPSSLINDIDSYATMMTKISKTDNTSIGKTFSSPNTKTGSKKGNSSASLDWYRTGLSEEANSKTTTDLKEEIKRINNDTTLTPDEKNRKLLETNQLYIAKNNIEKSEEFKKPLNNSIQNNDFWKERGVSNYKEYEDWKENNGELIYNLKTELEAYKEAKSKEPYRDRRGNLIDPAKAVYNPNYEKMLSYSDEELKRQLNNNWEGSALDNILNSNISYAGINNNVGKEYKTNRSRFSYLPPIANEVQTVYEEVNKKLLKPNRFWTYDITSESGELQKAINSGISRLPMEALANEGLLKIADEDGVFSTEATNETSTENGEKYKKFNNALFNSDNNKFELLGFSDGGINGNAVFQFKVTTGTGDDKQFHKIAIELDAKKINSSVQQFLNPEGEFYSKLDKKGQRLMDFIQDKIDYGGVNTDVAEISSEQELYNEEDSKNILNHSNKRLRSEGITNKGNDPIINKYNFYTSDNQYSIQLNDDNSFSSYKKDEDGNIEAYTMLDYANKLTLETAYAQNEMASLKDGGENKQYLENFGKINMLHNLVEEITDFENLSEESVIYNDDPSFKKALMEYDEITRYLTKKQIKSPEVVSRLVKIFDKISSLPVKSKLKKEIL